MASFLGNHCGLAKGNRSKFVDVAFILDKEWKEVEKWICKNVGYEDHVALGLHVLGPECLDRSQNKSCVIPQGSGAVPVHPSIP